MCTNPILIHDHFRSRRVQNGPAACFAGNCISHWQIARSIASDSSNLLGFPRLRAGHIACVGLVSMRRVSSLLFVLAFSAGTIASLPCVCAKDTIDVSSASPGTCSDRYNALIAEAKAALAKGDQPAALHGLIAARSQLRSCEERDHDGAVGAVAIALNSPSLSDFCR